MHNHDNSYLAKAPDEPAGKALFLDDLRRDMAAAISHDPGPDPTWDPGEWPVEEPRKEEES